MATFSYLFSSTTHYFLLLESTLLFWCDNFPLSQNSGIPPFGFLQSCVRLHTSSCRRSWSWDVLVELPKCSGPSPCTDVYQLSDMALTSSRIVYVRVGFSPHPRCAPKTLACPSGMLRASPLCALLFRVLMPTCVVGRHPCYSSRLIALSSSTWCGSSLPTLLDHACVLRASHRAYLARGVGSPPTLFGPLCIIVPTRGMGRGPPSHAMPWA